MLNDRIIIDMFFERSEQAIVELSEQYGTQATAIAYNILSSRSDAEECVNDAYLTMWNTIPPMRPDNLQAYFIRVIKNIAFNRFDYNTSKKRNNSYDLVLDELQECIPSHETVESKIMEQELTETINKFLGSLPKEDRVLFVGRYWMGEPVDVLAKKLGCSSNGLSVRLFRIRKKLKHYLKKEWTL